MKKKLLAKRAALVAELVAFGKIEEDGGTLTAEQLARFTAIQIEIEGNDGKGAQSSDQNCLDAQIARAEVVEARAAQLAAPVGTAQAAGTDPAAGSGNGGQPASGPQAATLFVNDAEFFATIASGRDDQRLAGYRSEQSMQDGTTGGFMVPKEYSGEMQRIEGQPAIVRPRARIIGPGTNPDASISFPVLNQSTENAAAPANVYSGVTVAYGSEGGAVAETGFKLKEIELKPQEVTAYVALTNKLLRNWSGAGGVATGLLNDARTADEDLRFLRGDGVGKPLGCLASAACISTARTGGNAFVYADAVNMIKSLLMRGGSPIWIMNQSVMPELLTMEDTAGNLIWQPNARDGVPQTLLGYPIAWNERSVALGSAGDVALVNLAYYWVKDGYGPIIAGSEHVQFLNNKTVFKMGYSHDGQPWLEAPFTDEGNRQVSPFVKLAA